MTSIAQSGDSAEALSVHIYDLLNNHFLVQALHVAATLGIADLLADGPRRIDDLASTTQTHAASLHRLLRMLAGNSVFAEDEHGRFGLTRLAALLTSNAPDSVRDWALFVAAPPVWAASGNLARSIRTGESAFEATAGMPLFTYLAEHPDLAQAYNGWMTRQSERQNLALLQGYDFSGFHHLVDVGAGQGSTLFSVLQAHEALTGVLFDLPVVVENVRVPDSLASRCQIIAGDMLRCIPADGDVYVLKRVLMDWSDDLAIEALANCRDVMLDDGKVLVIEPVVPPGNAPSVSKTLDMTMLVLQHGGCVRTEREHNALFAAAGLRVSRIIPTASPMFVIEGIHR